MIKQFVPQEVCLKCQGCCRFAELNSVWSPCLLDEEVLSLVDKENIPAVSISIDKKIVPVAMKGRDGFICPFLNATDNKCRAYDFRPFECQLYPFLICLRNKEVLVTVDLNCPYVKEKLNSKEFKEYVEYLSIFLNSPKQLKALKDNPQILQAYEEALEVIELKLPNET